MTVEELYKQAKILMFEKSSSKDYDNYYIGNTNALLSDLFILNNNVRESKELEPLTTIPTVKQPKDILPYEDEICKQIMPYGLAANFFIDDDLSKYDIFYKNYINAQAEVMRGIPTDIVDVYC